MNGKKINLKEMSIKQKIKYFWDYYRYHVLVIGMIGLLVRGVMSEIINHPKALLNIAISELVVDDEHDLTELEERLTKDVLHHEGNHEKINIYTYPFDGINNQPSELGEVYLEKFISQLAINDLDIFILEEQDFPYFNEQDAFYPLNELLEEINLNDITLNTFEKDGQIFGFKLEGNELLESYGFDTENKLITIFSNSLHVEESLSFITQLLRNESF